MLQREKEFNKKHVKISLLKLIIAGEGFFRNLSKQLFILYLNEEWNHE